MVILNPLTSISLYLISFFFSDPLTFLCEPYLVEGQCTGEFPIGGCALIKGEDANSNMPHYYQQYFDDICIGCKVPGVIGYKGGQCTDSAAQICTSDFANIKCPPSSDSVCTFSETINKCRPKMNKVSAKNSPSHCGGCRSRTSQFTVAGKCENLGDNIKICEARDRNVQYCQFQALEGACGYYTGDGCTKEICRKPMQNTCYACADPVVLFSISGTCQDT